MSGKRAKALRRRVYAGVFAPRFREYRRDQHHGAVIADDMRRMYQVVKLVWRHEERPALNQRRG